MSDASGTRRGGARRRLVLLLVGVALCALALVATGLEWGRLLVDGRLVVAEGGLSLWEGVVVLVAAALCATAMALAVAAGRGRVAALSALLGGVVIAAASAYAIIRLVTRPDDIADRVRAGAESIPLKGYQVPRLDSLVGAGAWTALAAGLGLAVVGLVAVIASAWGARGRPVAR